MKNIYSSRGVYLEKSNSVNWNTNLTSNPGILVLVTKPRENCIWVLDNMYKNCIIDNDLNGGKKSGNKNLLTKVDELIMTITEYYIALKMNYSYWQQDIQMKMLNEKSKLEKIKYYVTA